MAAEQPVFHQSCMTLFKIMLFSHCVFIDSNIHRSISLLRDSSSYSFSLLAESHETNQSEI